MFCNECGTKLNKNSNFCHICGAKVHKKDAQDPAQLSIDDIELNHSNVTDLFNTGGKTQTEIIKLEEEILNNNQISMLDNSSISSSYKLNFSKSINRLKEFFTYSESKINNHSESFFNPEHLIIFNNNKDNQDHQQLEIDLDKPSNENFEDETIIYSKKVIDSALVNNEGEQYNIFDDLSNIDDKASDSNYINDNDFKIEDLLSFSDSTEDSSEDLDTKNSLLTNINNFISSTRGLVADKAKVVLSSIRDFFFVNKSEPKEDDSIEIIIQEREVTDDTMPLIFSKKEQEILDKALKKQSKRNRLNNFFSSKNKKIAPIVRKLLGMGARSRLPMFIAAMLLSIISVWFNLKTPLLYISLGLFKLFITYVIVSVATNRAFSALNIKLSATLKSFFLIGQLVVYHLLDAVFVRLTLVRGINIEAIIHVISPNLFSFLIFIFLGIGLILLNYQNINNEKTIILFLGSYYVVSMTMLGLIIGLESILFTIFGSIIAGYMI